MSAPLLVLGANGQLGSDILRVAAARGLPAVGHGRETLDATRLDDVQRVVDDVRPGLVINCVAYTNVDKAEDEPAAAFAANAVAAANVAKAAWRAGARLMHASTSYVFDGTKKEPYTEADAPQAHSVYSATKLAGEHLARTEHPDACIVRLVALFGVAGARAKPAGNFVEAFAKRAKEGTHLRVISDQIIAPSFTRDVAEGMLELAARPALPAIVNLQNEGRCSWYDAAVHIVKRVGDGRCVVAPIPGAEYPHKARRPMNSAMTTDLFASLVGRRLRPWEAAIDAYLKEKGYA